jgi:hypothetical protein
MDEASVEGATTLDAGKSDRGRDPVSLDFTWLGKTVAITPETDLDHGTEYTLTVGTGAENEAGVPLGAAWSIDFTTEPSWPVVTEAHPADGATGVPLNTNVIIAFSQPMDQTTTEAAFGTDPVVAFSVHWENDDQVMRIEFLDDLTASTAYTVTVGATAEGADSGQPLPADYVLGFTAGTGVDDTPPTIVSWNPANGSTDVPRGIGSMSITFSEPVNPKSIYPELIDARFMALMGLFEDTEPDWNADFTMMTVQVGILPPGTEIFIDLTPFSDLAGNESANPPEWRVTTAGTADWFPAAEGDWWLGFEFEFDEGGMAAWEYIDKVEDVSGNDFDINHYLDNGLRSLDQLDSAEYMTKLSDRIELRGFGEYDEGDWLDQAFTPPIDFFWLPPTLGLTWSDVATIDLGEGETGDLTITGEILDFEDFAFGEDSPDDPLMGSTKAGGQRLFGRENGEPEAVFPECAVVELTHTIVADLGEGPMTVHEGIDTLWVCSGVGVVYERAHSSDWDGEQLDDYHGAQMIYLWSVGQ